jgi:hypothetical protein
MQPHDWQAGVLERRPEPAAQPVVGEEVPNVVHEHVVIVAGEVRATRQAIQRTRRLIDQRHRPDLVGLRAVLAAEHDRPPDVHDPLREVDVAPAERQQFAQPQAGERSDGVQSPVLRVRGVAGERGDAGRVEGTRKSPVRCSGCLSAAATGFVRSPWRRTASRNTPCSSTRLLLTLRVFAAGYNPDTLLLTPANAEALDLAVSGITGGTQDFVFTPAQFAPGSIFGMQRRISKTIPAAAVVDSQALGKYYTSPVSLARFEADAGTTNRSNVRLELNAVFGGERAAAAVRIAAS